MVTLKVTSITYLAAHQCPSLLTQSTLECDYEYFFADTRTVEPTTVSKFQCTYEKRDPGDNAGISLDEFNSSLICKLE